MDGQRRRGGDDFPVYSRLFVVCDKSLTEDQIRDAFDKFGTIEDVGMPKDHNTGKPKGVAFIKYLKTSEAASALNAMNKTVLPNTSRPLKVMVAANRSEIQTHDNSDEKYKRLFINTSKSEDENALEKHFKQFGRIESVNVQRDRETSESRCGAYVKYRTFYEAAIAFEQCDRKYRPIFAMPKGYKRHQDTAFESSINNLASTANNMNTSILSHMNVRPEGYTQVSYMCSPYVTSMQIENLFNIIPGLINFQYFTDLAYNCGKGTATYSSPICAAYAVEKLNRFEYPPGSRIQVKRDNQINSFQPNFPSLGIVTNNLKTAIAAAKDTSPDLAKLAEAIAEASKLIKTCTSGVLCDYVPSGNDLSYCSVKLPEPKPLAEIDSVLAKRCFLVCKPQPPPLTVLRDIFCRFGDLINVYTLPNKTVGYARYASVRAADEAINTLHGAEICGVRIKVLEAEDEAPPKRSRYD